MARQFGTGTAQKVWAWWDEWWQENIATGNPSFGDWVEGFFRFVAALVGTIVTGLIDIFVAFFNAIGDLFNATDDDDARQWSQNSVVVTAASDEEIANRLRSLLDGPTGDDDEAAILRILRALPCGRRRLAVNAVGLNALLDNLDGDEHDQLMLVLVECDIIGFGTMDDDASRLFVLTNRCPVLGSLPVSSVRQLVLNMFTGSCGDDDEDAILKLLQCQSTARLNALVNLSGTTVGDFDDNFDGEQWDFLESFLAGHGIDLDP
ncbi:MAG: hypothetical protein ACRCTR_05280 [Actinomycetota bacterium]